MTAAARTGFIAMTTRRASEATYSAVRRATRHRIIPVTANAGPQLGGVRPGDLLGRCAGTLQSWSRRPKTVGVQSSQIAGKVGVEPAQRSQPLGTSCRSAANNVMGRSVLITVGVIFLVLVLCRAGGVRAQAAAAVPPTQAAGRAALPKPAANLTAGTWKYKTTAVQPDGTYNWNHTVTIKDDGERWTVTYLQNIPAGNVTYVQSLEKDTLIVRTLSLNHFAKPGRAWPIIINLNVTDDRVAGT